ncbi:superoxide dismutase family protein [Vibrio parahaemolyticus]|uniref:superoxide dismutase family protein n=1 Tax=Vibrio parahaemolyticus TaxID=670 RepID=UPI0011248ED1|nr:superoxide dismutase family protein [Vibrio parahaemolyticus]TOF66768.1 superoxide dismutase [Vibrio parahaemolyticus]TOF73133.1 superoxide dismutase [Vibrio parahaemolyticus]
MLKGLLCISAAAAFVMTPNALAQSITMTDLGTNQAVGTVELSESDYGIVFTPNLSGIPAGLHGFPWTDGNHLGDLPALYADMEGNANQPVLAPRLKMSDLKGRALMIHAGGDNHSDQPAKLGGGGARIVCGVID